MLNKGDNEVFSGVSLLASVVESGSFVRASQRLGLSPSGLSRAMTRLESRLGVRLLERTTRTLKLTDEGRRLYDQVRSHIDGIAEAATLASGAVHTVRGTLRVNVDPYFARIALASTVAGFLAKHPDLSLELIMRDDVGDLVLDGFDLAVRFGVPPLGNLVTRKLLETRVLTVASPDYIRRRGMPKHPSEVLDHERILFFDAAARRPFGWEFRRGREVVEIEAKGHLLVSDVATMLGACAGGAGIAQILALGSEALVTSGQLVDLFPEWSGERFALYALYPSRRYVPAKLRAFLDFCLQGLSKPQQTHRQRGRIR
jgi:DNA-binding transcriptional LysR family regulator